MAPAKLKAKPAKGKAVAKKKPATKASAKAAPKPKVPAKILDDGTFVKFGGYRSDVDADEIVFSEGDVLFIIGSEQDDDTGLLYACINAADVGEFQENGDKNVEGGEVSPVEITELKGNALEKAREQFVPVEAMGKLAEMLEDTNDAIAIAVELNQEIQETYFWLGGALAMVLQQGAYLEANGGDYSGEDAFNDFCNAEFGFKASKGRQLARVYSTFSQIPDFDPSKLDSVGWSKAAIAERFVTEENVDEVLELAESTGQRELAHTLKIKYVKDGETDSGRAASRGTGGVTIVKKTLSYRLDEDSAESVILAVQQCMKQTGIENEALALEAICVEWAGDHVEAATAQKRIKSKSNKGRVAREKAAAPKAPAKKAAAKKTGGLRKKAG